jgi:trehalose 6-phosphate phosphatase
MSLDRLPPLPASALLLDLDGTLLDLAPAPESVVVPPGLSDTLRALRDQLGGALAIVTGRPVETIDALLGDAPYAVAGEHGGTVRHAPGEPLLRARLPAPPASWLEASERLAAAHPGVRLERKARGFALHFRAAPEAGPAVHDALTAMLARSAAFELLPAHMLWEVRPRGMDKGKAVRALMARAPFAGRKPVFIGDDVTDEDAIRAARALGGAGYQVAPAFGSPSGVRDWLNDAAAAGEWPRIPLPSRGTGRDARRQA